MKTLLIVCTGNTCRSPMAEAIARSIIQSRGLAEKYQVVSAGTGAFKGDRASANAVKVMAALGLDLSIHRSQPLTKELVDSADLILTMTEGHRRQTIFLAPDSSDKVWGLKAYAGETGDLPDPFGGSEEIYRRCAQDIQSSLEKALERWFLESK